MQRFHIHRFEFKYLLTLEQYIAIKKELLNYTEYDSYSLLNADKSYMVYSLYYDSSILSNFWEKIDGLKDRKKFRFRVYDINSENEPDIYLEIKRKKNFIIVKDRAKLDYRTHLSAVNNGLSLLLKALDIPLDQKAVVNEFIYNVIHFNLCPKILVAYKREAFLGKYHSNIRITLDSNIKSYKTNNLFPVHKQPDTVLSREVVLELKFNGSLPWWFHHFIQKYNLVKDTHSKYCMSMIESYNITV
jgi:SPX domain protein involved in polyphosphate accumulation